MGHSLYFHSVAFYIRLSISAVLSQVYFHLFFHYYMQTHGVRVLIAKTRGDMCVRFVTVGVRRRSERFRALQFSPFQF